VLFRSINKTGPVWGTEMTPIVLWEIVRGAAPRASIDKLASHDLRRSCARLCHLAGGELDQIQFLPRTRLYPDNRALPRLQAEVARRSLMHSLGASSKHVVAFVGGCNAMPPPEEIRNQQHFHSDHQARFKLVFR
jgi:hypothetical protein